VILDGKLDIVRTFERSNFKIIGKNIKLMENRNFYAKPVFDKLDFVLFVIIRKQIFVNI